jgi:hypothetical protein
VNEIIEKAKQGEGEADLEIEYVYGAGGSLENIVMSSHSLDEALK